MDDGNGTATLSGIPGPEAGGTYSLSITASNGFTPDASQSFSLTVDEPPSITAANPPLTGHARQLYSYTFAASGFPVPTFSLTGPSWLSVDPTTGVLPGTVPTHPRTFSYSLTATNAVGSVAIGPFTG
jgi:hypothetical protein